MTRSRLLSQRATIERATRTVTAAGDVVLDWTAVAAEVPCLLEERDVESVQEEMGLALAAAARLHLPPGTDLRPGSGGGVPDRIRLEGALWLVAGVREEAGPPPRPRVAELVREAE
jgi:hypothetical protein